MKVLAKLALITMLVMLLTLVACSTPPQAVGRSQYQTAMSETTEAEEAARKSDQELQALETELSRREAELRSLRDYERQLGF